MRTKPNPTLGSLGGDIKRKGLISEGLTMECIYLFVFICLQVDGPINFWQGGRRGGGLQIGAYKLDFKVYMSPDRRTIVRIHRVIHILVCVIKWTKRK